MIYRELCGEKVSMLGFGAMRLPPLDPANPRGGINKDEAIALIRYAYEHGVNYFDTAYVYGGGQSEIILGEALSIYPRDTYFIATKFPGSESNTTIKRRVPHGSLSLCVHLCNWPSPPISAVISSIRSSGNGGAVSGFMAMLISFIGLSSAAMRLDDIAPQRLHLWITAHSPPLRTHTATGSINPPQSLSRSPGSISTCRLVRQLGQWLR